MLKSKLYTNDENGSLAWPTFTLFPLRGQLPWYGTYVRMVTHATPKQVTKNIVSF